MMKQVVRYISALPMVGIVVCIGLQYIYSNDMAVKGKVMYDIDMSVDRITKENEKLKKLLSEAESMTVIYKIAKENGFSEPSSFVTIPSNFPVAYR